MNPTIKSPTCQEFNGVKYYLCKSGGSGYFLRQEFRHRGKMRLLHRMVWEHSNGPIPPKMDIHHVDGNTSNNTLENLECLTRSAHRQKHHDAYSPEQRAAVRKNLIDNAIPKSKAWHGTPEGIEWHRQHALKINLGKSRIGSKVTEEAKASQRAKRAAYFQTEEGKALLVKMREASIKNQQRLREKRHAEGKFSRNELKALRIAPGVGAVELPNG